MACPHGIDSGTAPEWRRQRFAVVDVETTGLRPQDDRIIEIAVVEVDGTGRLLEEYCSLVRIDGPVGASWIHGLDALALSGAPRFEELVDALEARLGGRVAVGHGVAFDLAFLESELARTGRGLGNVPRVCTMQLAAALGVTEGSHRLTRACAAQGIAVAGAHRALADARATALLLRRYLQFAESAGHQTLGELVEITLAEAGRFGSPGQACPVRLMR
jgi:DNA polymerase III epsilon subunit-like protein